MIERSWSKPLFSAAPLILAEIAGACPSQSPDSAASPARDLGLILVQAETGAALASLPAANTSPSSKSPAPQVASPSTSDALTASQLQSLPLPRRNWESFVFDAPGQDGSADEDAGGSAETGQHAPTVTIDGANMHLTFGGSATARSGTRGSSLIGLGPSEAAIREVQFGGAGNSLNPVRLADERANLVTERGSNRLHGQAFAFDRQGLWGAKNPFTSWVQEATPATAITTPTFAAVPYSPDDREWIWGVGAGGAVRRDRLFWFASLDGSQRNDPGVSMVKHPEDFFAQPANDQMQVLSARLGLSSANPVGAGLTAFSKMLETLDGLLGPAPRSSSPE
jgi:hypothetical protein